MSGRCVESRGDYLGVGFSAVGMLHIIRWGFRSVVVVVSSECFVVMMGLLLMLRWLRLMAWLMLSLVGGGFHVVGRLVACFCTARVVDKTIVV